MRRARLARYSLWQMLDFAINRGIALLLIGALLLMQVALQLRSFTQPGQSTIALPREILLRMGWSIFWSFAFIAVLMTVNGMISGDRKQGYYRFLFSKPVSTGAYYATAYIVGLAGVLLATLLMYLGVWRIGVRLPIQVLAAVPLLYALIGATGFLFSTLMNREWLGVIGTLVATAYLRLRADQAGGPVETLARYLLPPIHLSDVVRDATLAGGMPEPTVVFWPLAYGGAVFAAALLILRRRQLA